MKAFLWITFIPLILLLGFKLTFALTVSPAKIEFNLDPGEVVNFSLSVRNDQDFDVYLYSEVEGFTEEGTNKIFLGKTPEVSWIKIPEKIFTPAKKDVDVPITLKIPKDAPPGGHFLAIWWSTTLTGKREWTDVSIGVRVASLIYINVSGKVEEKIALQNLQAKRLVFSFPVRLQYQILNQGNTYIRPKGEVLIKNIFGRLVANLPVNQKEVQILPGKAKIFENSWQNNFAFGPYRAIFQIRYGQNKELSFTYWFFMLPIKAILILLLMIVFLVFVLPKLVKKYNQWIIQKALKNK